MAASGRSNVLIALLLFVAVGCAQAAFKPDIIVAKDGSSKYKTVQAALKAVPPATNAKQGKVIYIKAGVYNESVVVQPFQKYLTIIGDPGQTKIVFNRYSGQLDANGDPFQTAGSGTFIALADHFTAVNIIFENSVPRPPPNTFNRQAVALRVAGNYSYILNCTIKSYQDTLYAHKGIQYYKGCTVYGSIDFVFGYAKAYFEDCTLSITSLGYGGFVAQRKRFLYEDNAFVFNKCRLTGKGRGFLGRAWGKFSTTIFANSYMEDVVEPSGWDNFLVPSRRYTSFFAEYNNRGIGANLEGRVFWERTLTAAQVKFYVTPNWIQLSKWLPVLPSPLPGVAPIKRAEPPAPKLKPSDDPRSASGCNYTTTAAGAKKNNSCYSCCRRKHPQTGPYGFIDCYHFCVFH
eukprot:jgi/Mesen1/10696/ME000090S10156